MTLCPAASPLTTPQVVDDRHLYVVCRFVGSVSAYARFQVSMSSLVPTRQTGSRCVVPLRDYRKKEPHCSDSRVRWLRGRLSRILRCRDGHTGRSLDEDDSCCKSKTQCLLQLASLSSAMYPTSFAQNTDLLKPAYRLFRQAHYSAFLRYETRVIHVYRLDSLHRRYFSNGNWH